MHTIGLAIITKDRNDFIKEAYKFHLINTLPFVNRFIIVDDHSKESVQLRDFPDPYGTSGVGRLEVHRPLKWLGVAGARNYALNELSDCDYIFLLDDDLLPKSNDWIQAHIRSMQSGYNLLIHQPNELTECYSHFESFINNVTVTVHSTATLFVIDQHCLQTLGGFDTTMGYYGHEDTDYFTRARAAGILPTEGYYTLINTEFYLHAFDIYGDYPPIQWMRKSALGEAKWEMIEQSRTRLIEINATGDNPIYKPFAG
jgi:glycosyltransferase involved in cell wall biosynthesis